MRYEHKKYSKYLFNINNKNARKQLKSLLKVSGSNNKDKIPAAKRSKDKAHQPTNIYRQKRRQYKPRQADTPESDYFHMYCV